MESVKSPAVQHRTSRERKAWIKVIEIYIASNFLCRRRPIWSTLCKFLQQSSHDEKHLHVLLQKQSKCSTQYIVDVHSWWVNPVLLQWGKTGAKIYLFSPGTRQSELFKHCCQYLTAMADYSFKWDSLWMGQGLFSVSCLRYTAMWVLHPNLDQVLFVCLQLKKTLQVRRTYSRDDYAISFNSSISRPRNSNSVYFRKQCKTWLWFWPRRSCKTRTAGPCYIEKDILLILVQGWFAPPHLPTTKNCHEQLRYWT